jgi:hypothetical protein
MAISPPSFTKFKRSRIEPVNKTSRSESDWTGSVQISELEKKMWRFTLDTPALSYVEAGPWTAWLTRLKGGAETTLLTYPDRPFPEGDATGTGSLGGISADGSTVTVSGFSSTGGPIFKAGDFISITPSGGWPELKIVEQDVPAGTSSVEIWPPLHTIPSGGGGSVNVDTPLGEFFLATDEISFNTDMNKVHQLSIPFRERVS